MATILLAVTVTSLLVAIIMSAVAWRVSREERARAAARVAALAAASSLEHDPIEARADSPAQWSAPRVPPVVTPQPVARAAQVPEASLAAFAAEELPLRPVASAATRTASEPVAASPDNHTLFGVGERPQESASRQRGLVFAAVILFVVLGGGAYWALSSRNANTSGAAAAARSSVAPLELVSLRHERHGSRLSLAGLVRNPSAGMPVEDLTTVVFLFDAQGGFITSGRAGVDFKRIAPGDESPFVITVEAPSNVARYRVSFRNDAGLVAHVDRRGEPPVAAAAVGKD
jgi:hypothetical protein